MGKLFTIVILAVSLAPVWIYYTILNDADPPLLPDFYWGPSSKQNQKESIAIRPFRIKVEDKVLDDLFSRLRIETEDERLMPPLEGIGFQYGFNTNILKNITKHWLNEYDWRSREKLLNSYPQFKTTIAGIEIHFQHIRYTGSKRYEFTRPLLLLHGWPGSFVEFQKAIPLLLEPKDSRINFLLVIPSLPGYGFSERAHRPGLGPAEMAQIFVKLMSRLGHKQFYVQGGDWGSIIASDLASLYPNSVKGLHMNLCISQHSRSFVRILIASIYPSLFMEEDEIGKLYPLSKYVETIVEETGYMHIQATKPDTVGVALSNSPSGLAAYILEKFSSWTNLNWRTKEDGGLLPYYDINELIDNLMVYWVTNSITSSLRLYSEAMSKRTKAWNLNNVSVKIPTGCFASPEEYFGGQTKFHLQDKYPNLVRYTKVEKGGHFAAFEIPNIFSKEVISFFNEIDTTAFIRLKK